MSYEKSRDLMASYNQARKSGILDYRSREMPIWCPGCGDYAVAHALTLALNELKIEPRSVAISAGIGCSGRFPVFIKGYGFHGVHGRSLPLATGMKLANDDLTVFAVGGDGDGLGIGGGHLPHAARNNIDITYILFDNSIYGLTKGQTSPTAQVGTVSKTTPYGSEGEPLNASKLVLSYGGTFVARAFSGYPHKMKELLKSAIRHRGFSFVHALTPCVVFNKQITYDDYYEKCRSLPASYKPDDPVKAVKYAADKKRIYMGIFYQEKRGVFGDKKA
jgi:2-oxoglutarate ferredoxin oxidoreductase subunit beta